MMIVSATSIYANAEAPNESALLIAAAFAIVLIPAVTIWAGFGVAVSKFLNSPKRRRAFNITMGLLLVAALIPMVR